MKTRIREVIPLLISLIFMREISYKDRLRYRFRKSIQVILLLTCLVNASENFRVVGYSYGVPPGINMYDFSAVTHLIGSFVTSDPKGNLTFDLWVTKDDLLAVLKEGKQGGAVPMISLGTTKDTWEMTKSKASRENFITNILEFCETNGIEGIDLDLEGFAENEDVYPWLHPDSVDFWIEPYESLAVELRAAMPDEMLLTCALSANPRGGFQWTDTFLEQLNFINVMIYDMALWGSDSPIENHSTWEHHIAAADYWHKTRGVAKERLNLGAPFYAKAMDIDNSLAYGEDAGWDMMGFSYKDFVHQSRFNLTPATDSFTLLPGDSIIHPRLEGRTGEVKVFFNGRETIKRKTEWSIESGYGGVMFWQLKDDLPTSDVVSLLSVIDSVVEDIAVAVESGEQITNRSPAVLVGNQLNLGKGEYTVQLFTLGGREIESFDIIQTDKSSISINVDSYSNGLYIVRVINKQLQDIQNFQLISL